jgi:transposase InsO family protein
VRPATGALYRFVGEHHERFGVVPICRALSTSYGLQIAPRSYYAWLARGRGPSRRQLWDLAITEILAGYYQPDEHGRRRPESLYGAEKMWAHLQRQGIPVARCTIERLMRANGWQGVRRSRRIRTTIPSGVARAVDLVNRQFGADAPSQLLVADFTYVPLLAGGFAYTAFVVDAFAGKIVGWQVAGRADTALVTRAWADAVETRRREGHPITPGAIHHNDAGTQYTALAFGQHLAEAGILPSIGSVGDAYDNALAETTIGLYKTECTRAGSPFHTGLRTVADVEAATAAWVHWYNTSRLMHRLGRRPPADAEADYYAQPNPTDIPVGK